jgi:Fe2+ transport system protein FeoA
MTLWDAPFRKRLRILDLSGFGGSEDEIRLVLTQLGVDEGETIEKIHAAPLRDPVSLRIGEQVFTLRAELCRKIRVEALAASEGAR